MIAAGNSLVINRSPSEVRVALLENGLPAEVHFERGGGRGVVGNIYRGRVVRVLPGMQAAFVNIGLERTAFLYVNDAIAPQSVAVTDSAELAVADAEDAAAEMEATPEPPDDAADLPPDPAEEMAPPLVAAVAPAEDGGGRAAEPRSFRGSPLANIADVLSEGQDIVVQVQKEPLGTKGARLTRHVAIPGRFLVFLPFSQHIGVSHRILDSLERDRLKNAVATGRDVAGGFIVRTAAEGVDTERLAREAQLLQQVWQNIDREGQKGSSPRLLFSDLDVVLRAVRDLFTGDVAQIVVDSADDRDRIRNFLTTFDAALGERVKLYDAGEPIFDHFGVEVEIQRALERKVWLKSGGYVVIDQAEALTAIDVNSGRFVGKSNLEDTITQINLEAVKEVAYQLRLRNIGGIIIIDFIDMANAANREKVFGALEEALRRDKAKTTIVRMSEIGLVEMTRKRVRESLGHALTEDCPYCKGRGFIKSEETVVNEILRIINRLLSRSRPPKVLVHMHPEVADRLFNSRQNELSQLEALYDTRIVPVTRGGFHRECYEILPGSAADT